MLPEKITSHINYRSHKKSHMDDITQDQDTSVLLELFTNSGSPVTEDLSQSDLVADHWIDLRCKVESLLGSYSSYLKVGRDLS